MSKKNRKRNTPQSKSQRSWLLWGAAAVALLFVVGGLSLVLITGDTTKSENGSPKLVVDQPVIDEGYQKLDKTIRTSFTLRNEGDATLRIQGEPQVKLVEGC